MQRFRVWLFLVVVLGVFVPVASWAQHTGGSFGGSSWGSGRSSSSSGRSSGSSWGGSRSSGTSWGSSSGRSSWGGSSSSGSYGGGSYGSYGGGSSNGGGGSGALCCVVFFFIVVILIGMALSKKKGGNAVSYAPPQNGYGGMPGGGFTPETFSLGALAIAFDATVRAQVQGELDRIAQSMQNTPDALENAARTMASTLSRFLDSAYMTHHAVSQGLSMQATQQQFQAAVDQERGRYIIETVRADAGGVRKINAPASRGRAEEGGGFVVVTLLIARRGNLTGFVPASTRDALRADLQALLAGPGALQAMEVVWVPSDPNDVMSSAEMAVKFPTLKPIAPDARVGRRACGSCKTVYAAELGNCPNCGAPPA